MAGRKDKIRYIVLHYTANDGDTAQGNCKYFAGQNRQASAHYFVDDTSVWQSVRDTDTAWHCGGVLQGNEGHEFYRKCTNANSIGVEMCSQIQRGKYIISEKTAHNAVELTRQLMRKYGIPAARVIRHYDVTGKECPRPWIGNNTKWIWFKNKIVQEEVSMTTTDKQEYDIKIKELERRIFNLEHPMVYHYIDENMPAWSKEAVRFFCEKRILAGNGNGLDLSDTKLWMLTILYRAVGVLLK